MTETTPSPSNDNQQATRGGSPRLFDADMIAALAAVVVGACALSVSIYQSMMMREQQQASVWPHVEIGREYRHEGISKGILTLIVQNTGIGPARLMTLRVQLDGKYQTDWASTMKALGVPAEKIQSRATITGRVLSPGKSVQAIVAEDDLAANPLQAATTVDRSRLEVEICYCSIYDRCYRVSYLHQEDIAVDACAHDPKVDFRE
jgi:hypothetical protein